MFAWLLVESIIHDRQDEYYKVINRSNNEAKPTAFDEFMLSAIKEALTEAVQVGNTENMSTEEQRRYQIERFLKKRGTITNADCAGNARGVCGYLKLHPRRIDLRR